MGRTLAEWYGAGHAVASLPRLTVFGFNLNVALWASESEIMPTPRNLVIAVRISSICAIIFNAILFTTGLVIDEHWCCYGIHTTIAHLDLGLCTDGAKAPIHHSSRFQECLAGHLRPETWVIIALALGFTLAWLVLWIYRLVRLHRALPHLLGADEAYVMKLCMSHQDHIREVTNSQMEPSEVAGLLTKCIGALDKLGHARHWTRAGDSGAPRSAILLHRSSKLLLDPVCYLFQLPSIVLNSGAGVLMVGLLLNAIWLAAVGGLWFHSLGQWRDDCCYSGAAHYSLRHELGKCSDTGAYAHRSEAASQCGWRTFTWQIWLEVTVGGLALLLSIAHYVAVIFTYRMHAEAMVTLWLRAAAESVYSRHSDLKAAGGHFMHAQMGEQLVALMHHHAAPFETRAKGS